ncbi:MAG TPA: fructose-bisphosphate aldolase [Gammaproteobacteria bacterium]|nr:fructose-bisphosphate aldolase [Gammaproteobacteria bacterium]
MALVNMRDMLRHARENSYAVGAFDLVSLDFLEAVVAAAEKSRAAIILSVEESHFAHYDFELMMSAVETAARRADAPVAIQLDHGSSLDSVGRAIRLGCNGVMIDASRLALPENIETTRAAAELAHACGVMVVGELGHVHEVDAPDKEPELTSAAEAVAYVERTGIDCLAVSIGTVRGRTRGRARLDFQRLKQLRQVIDIPMEIHGGSGLNEEQARKLTALGVAKINYYTALSELAARITRQHMKQDRNTSFITLKQGVREAIREEVQHRLRQWGSAGRAAEVIEQCEPWENPHYIIRHPHRKIPDKKARAALMRRGRQQLHGIPGVRDLFLGETGDDAPADSTLYWDIRLTHPVARKTLETHPDYRMFKTDILGYTSRD